MVGHTGSLPAAIKAVETIDECVQKVVDAMLAHNGTILITADHGNCEQMIDYKTGEPHTAHTTNPVPLILVTNDETLKVKSGKLADLAPTMLEILGIEKPEEMTKEVLNEKLSSKMLVGQIINIDKAYVKLYKIEDVQEHSTYKRWEEDLGSDGQVNAIYFMFAVCIISYISMLTRKDGSSKCKKVIIVDNPFGATSAVFLWKVMFEILKENNVQLIAPGHNISKEIISMFEVNYVLKHEFKDGNKKTVVVEQEFRTEDSLKNMNFDTIEGNQQKLF